MRKYVVELVVHLIFVIFLVPGTYCQTHVLYFRRLMLILISPVHSYLFSLRHLVYH